MTSKNILIIDDSNGRNHTFYKELENEGFAISILNSTEQELIGKSKAQLIIVNSKCNGEASINLIKNFVDERLVVLIRNQEIDDYKLKVFSSLFGDLDPPAPNPYGVNFLPEHPEINVISNVINDDGIPKYSNEAILLAEINRYE